jgi:hypothetical protein
MWCTVKLPLETGGIRKEPDYSALADPELEAIIQALVDRKNEAPEGSAERRFYLRQLQGLRDTRELAGPIMEELDAAWGYF